MGSEKEDDITDALIRLPIRNLESRIMQLDSEISRRKTINDEALTCIDTLIIQLKSNIWHHRYSHLTGEDMRLKKDFDNQLQNLKSQSILEQVNCFRDIANLNEKMQSTREELELEKTKLRLIDTDLS
ncbi:MAG: hypothetical protein KAR42_04760 [candidate division Zixibacteria bacterium]|nr:hypothetical protein [candidate division Zixibacteria bacterium]